MQGHGVGGSGGIVRGMARAEIPRHLDAVTPSWLTTTLQGCGLIGTAMVCGFEVEKLGEGEGFMGDTARLHLEFAGEAPENTPATLVIKIPTSDRWLRGQGEALGIYEREIFFYHDLAPRLPVKLPRCYYAAMDPRPFGSPEKDAQSLESLNRMPRFFMWILMWLAPFLARLSRRRYVLLLEDLAPARLGDQVEVARESDLLGATEALAQLQAFCWNSHDIERLPWIHSVTAGTRIASFAYDRNRRHFEEKYGDRISTEVRSLLDWLSDHAGRISEYLSHPPGTLIHGDYRLDNLFFDDRSEDRRPILADWQVPSWGSGAYDLAYFLTGSLEVKASEEREQALVGHYHDALLAAGVSDYSFERCWADYRAARLIVLVRMVSTIAEIHSTNERAEQLFSRWVDRLFARVEGTDPEALLTGKPE